MRPTISEQLRETRRILSDVLAPQLGDAYASQILGMALSNLEMLETGWANALPFLSWDNQATLQLLHEVAGDMDAAVAADIAGAAGADASDPYDAAALQARNVLLNALLERALLQCKPAGLNAAQAHLLERTARYPMRPIKAGPAKPRDTEEH